MKWYKNFVVFWSVLYLLMALIGRLFTADMEIYPFFRWSLYSRTPNATELPFVMVQKIGDSILPEPENILNLQSLHKINRADMNLNVIRFHKELRNGGIEKAYQGDFIDILPKKSVFVLYLKSFDLSKSDYKNTEVVTEIAKINDNQIYLLNEADN